MDLVDTTTKNTCMNKSKSILLHLDLTFPLMTLSKMMRPIYPLKMSMENGLYSFITLLTSPLSVLQNSRIWQRPNLSLMNSESQFSLSLQTPSSHIEPGSNMKAL